MSCWKLSASTSLSRAGARKFYAERNGRPSLTPGIYFRALLIGYFEGIGAERSIAWRLADSPALRRFVGIALDEYTPDHSTISRARALREQGHEVRIPAQYVKPYVKTNKSDYIDAEAIAEAVGRPRMRFVPIKTDDQLDLQSLHRGRRRWVMPRTAVINQSKKGRIHLRRPNLSL